MARAPKGVLRLSLVSTLRFIVRHPLNQGRSFQAVSGFARWQVASRLQAEHVVPWVEGASLSVRRGMTGATGNIYCGLHAYPDMSFVLHLLRPGDLFADVGSYTVLASAVSRARSVSVEPDPGTMARLRRNVTLNGVEALVRTEEVAVGAKAGTVGFTVGLDTINRVALDMSGPKRTVKLAPLDDLLAHEAPVLIKLDVEGFETEVLKGAERTLADPGVAAILAEDDGAEVGAVMARHGFVRVGKVPSARRLVSPEEARGTNGLFVRRRSWIEERVASAPTRRCGPYLV